LGRAEENYFKETADVVTGRAFAPLAIQLEMSAPAAVVGGRLVLLRTPKDIELSATWKVARLGLAQAEVVQRSLPNGIADRAALIYRKSAKTPDRFPRNWAEAKRKPLFSAPQD
jgi:16S rRNA (guanine527-N7)-methyltransferase